MTVARAQSRRLRGQSGREIRYGAPRPRAGQDPDEVLAWERTADIHDALLRLGDPCGAVLRALFLDADQPTYATIAARLGRSVASIGPMREGCLHRLRSLLGEEAR